MFKVNMRKPATTAISGYCLGSGSLLILVVGDIWIAFIAAECRISEVKLGTPLLP